MTGTPTFMFKADKLREIGGFEDALRGVDPGSFSERVRTLDNRMLYKPSFAEK